MRKVNLLSKAEMRKVMGGVADDSATPRCKTGSCSLYVRELGITVDNGTCEEEITGGSSRCYCQAGAYQTDPNSWSVCNE